MSDCQAVVNIAGKHYQCELEAPHPGLAHANKEGQVIWCSHYEAVRHSSKARPATGKPTVNTPTKAGIQ